jgi:predicted ATPase/signal transduction histidine kinase
VDIFMSGQSLSLGKFELIEVLQVNEGFAVALCLDPQRQAQVVCKTSAAVNPSDEQMAALRREFELAEKAQGEGVVKVLGMERSETGCPILIFEHFQGTRLELGDSPMGPREYLPIFIQIARALSHVHAKKIIHRDLNPDNILWNRQTREVRIIDFNLATDILAETVKAGAVESLCGTLPFISPEQTGRMNRKVDFRSDYYSLGMTFYHVLAGASPFQAHDAMGWVYCHITEQPPLLSDLHAHVPQALARIINKLLAKNAEDRYQSSFGLLRDLELVLEGLGTSQLDSFVPGRFDVAEWLSIPEKLYGRENELATFLSFFDRVRAGEKFMGLIAGSSGMGKSVLVHEVNKPVIAARGNFIASKCDQYKRNLPYSAIKPAFADIVRQYLAKPVEELEYLRRQIMEHIGENAQVIAEIVPELETITGPLKPVTKLPPPEARVRFQKAFEKLVRILTAGGQPLVAFLDDLQWSDIPSLKLIEYLMLEADLSSFMIVAVFRDNEVQPGHPLLATLDEIRKSYDVPTIKLSPLSKNAIAELLCDTLHSTHQEVMELADILSHKTAGNPFHITEMIKTLHESAAISFDSRDGRWRWNVQEIKNAGISHDVVELMLGTLQKCSVKAQERLKIAACIGAQFDLSVLAAVTEGTEQEVLEDLWPTIEKGLIIPLGESYKLLKTGMSTSNRQFHFKFQHDRVHEAAYLLIDEAQRPLTHLQIGRLLRRRYQGRGLENQIIETVRHYNLAIHLIKDPNERLEVCQLNLMAAVKNRNSVAYEASVQHLKLAQQYLPGSFWTEHYALALKVHMNLSEVAFLIADYALVEATNGTLLTHVQDVLDRAEVNSMRIEQKFSRGLSQEARDIGVASLHDLGLRFPLKPNKLTVLKHVLAMKRRLRKTNLDRIMAGPRLEDRRLQLILKQLVALNPIFFAMADRMASAVSVLENLRLSLEHGICPESAYGFVGSASIFGNLIGNLPLGNKLGKVALDITDSFAVPAIKPGIYHVYTSFVAPFNIDLDNLPEYVGMTIEAGLAAGDLYFLPVAATLSQTYALQLSLPEQVEKDESYYLHLTRNSHNQKCHELNLFLSRMRRLLMEKPTESQLDEFYDLNQKACRVFEKDQFLVGRFVFEVYLALLHHLLGDPNRAWQHITQASSYFLAGRGTFHETEYHFFHAIIMSQVWSQLSAKERKEAMKRLKFSLQRMKLISSHQPSNFQYKYLIMQAELLAIKCQTAESLELCEQALDQIKRNAFREVGLIHEICARRYQMLGRKKLAHVFIKDALTAFKAWQAGHKVALLMEQWPILKQDAALAPQGNSRHPSLRSKQKSMGTNRGMGNQALDMLTITRASQTLSGQVEMEALVQHLMKIIVENAGAHYGVLMLRDKGRNFTRVIARTLNNETTLLKDQPLSDCHELSHSIMLYTSRINETVIVDDVERDEKYRADAYLQKVRPKSILAMPILIKGQAIGYFYLENRLLTGSFTRDRVEVLNILGTQAAISLENAQLYANLEQRVRERTAQLAEKNRDIRSILTHIKQGILTITDGMRVHPEYSQHLETILETTNIADRDVMELIFAGSLVSVDMQDQIRGTLDFSLRQDQLCFQSNENLLIRELTRKKANGEEQYLELDWQPVVNPEEQVEKIMVTIRDVTEVRKLKEASERSRLELSLLGQILNAGAERYQSFMNNAQHLLTRVQALLQEAGSEDQETMNIAYRQLHTVKGNARLLAFTELASLVHECESILMRFRTQSLPFAKVRADLLGFLPRIHESLGQYQQVYQEKLLAYASHGQNFGEQRLVAKLKSRIQDWESTHPDLSRELRSLLDSAQHPHLDEVLAPLRANVRELARELGKEAPRFQTSGLDLELHAAEASLLTNALIHLLSNAIHHGLESPEEREACGKCRQGTITINAADEGHQHRFVIYDDGRGLNLEMIRRKAVNRQLIGAADHLSEHELAMLIFKSGFSTAETVTQSAGRGVGTDAILDMVREAGGELQLILDPHSPAERKAFRIEFTLPRMPAAAHEHAA